MPSSATATVLSPPPIDLLQGASLFLDFDGTLVDIAGRPDAVAVDPALRETLSAVTRQLNGRVAIVSGRAAGEIRALFGADAPMVAGSHGLEIHWADGRIESPEPPAGIAPARAALHALAAEWPGVLVEEKPLGVAVHYRLAPEAEAACRASATQIAAETGLKLQPGKMVFELRAPGADKGEAVRTLLASATMAGSTPVFIGDDETDEQGFAAAAALGGAGILVGPDRPSHARYRLPDVAAVRAWLNALVFDDLEGVSA